jgi:hypothetical protein
MAAAEEFGRVKGARVKRVEKEEGVRRGVRWVCGEREGWAGVEDVGWIEDMACDVDVNVNAWVMSCLSFA